MLEIFPIMEVYTTEENREWLRARGVKLKGPKTSGFKVNYRGLEVVAESANDLDRLIDNLDRQTEQANGLRRN